MQLLLGVPVVHMVHAGVELGVFDTIGRNVLPAKQIAEACNTPEDATHRLLRGLSAVGVLHEHTDERFSLSPIGKLLCSQVAGSFEALARLSASSWLGDAYRELPHAVRTGESGFTKQHGRPLFQWLAEHSTEADTFARAMSTFSAIEAELILGHFDFGQVRHVVDVGGGHGLLMSRILERAPRVQATLFDTPETLEQARQRLEADMLSRCALVAGDFFDGVPGGADLYLLKHILHDWSDANALRILENVANAMPNGATLLVMEQGIAQPGIPNPGKVLDIVLLGLLDGGRERTVEQHANLMSRAGLEFEREITTPGPITLYMGHK